MDRVEIDSFVKKFKALCDAGYYASLNLESKLGEVYVNLSCKVGRTTQPPYTPPACFDTVPKYRSPSYYRRQARRRVSRDTGDMKVVDSKTSVADEVSEVVSEEKCDMPAAMNENTVVSDNAEESIELVENVNTKDSHVNDYSATSYVTNELSEITAADKVEDASDKREEHDENKVSDGVKDTIQSKDDMKTKTGMVYYAFVPPPVR